MPSGSHDINVKLLALMGIVSTILVFSLVVAAQAWFRYEFALENERKFVNVPFRPLVKLEEEQLAELNKRVMVGSGETTAIDWAMQQVVKEHAQH